MSGRTALPFTHLFDSLSHCLFFFFFNLPPEGARRDLIRVEATLYPVMLCWPTIQHAIQCLFAWLLGGKKVKIKLMEKMLFGVEIKDQISPLALVEFRTNDSKWYNYPSNCRV